MIISTLMIPIKNQCWITLQEWVVKIDVNIHGIAKYSKYNNPEGVLVAYLPYKNIVMMGKSQEW